MKRLVFSIVAATAFFVVACDEDTACGQYRPTYSPPPISSPANPASPLSPANPASPLYYGRDDNEC